MGALSLFHFCLEFGQQEIGYREKRAVDGRIENALGGISVFWYQVPSMGKVLLSGCFCLMCPSSILNGVTTSIILLFAIFPATCLPGVSLFCTEWSMVYFGRFKELNVIM